MLSAASTISSSLVETLGFNTTLEMAYIPAGHFMMGSSLQEPGHRPSESPQHEVSISPFYLGRYPVTQEQWLMASRLPRVSIPLSPRPSIFTGRTQPVQQVSWLEATEFCNRLAAYLGKPYRLPSEAEWEFACRAGTDTAFSFGDQATKTHINYNDGSSKPEAVGFYPPNRYGLYEMHGNIAEWCQDAWHSNYAGAPDDGSPWIMGTHRRYRVVRGGSWTYEPTRCRSAYRDWEIYDRSTNLVGLRVACSAEG